VTPSPEVAPVFVRAVIQEVSGDGGDKTNRKATRRRRGRQAGGIIEAIRLSHKTFVGAVAIA
jgi:hypothetical protein